MRPVRPERRRLVRSCLVFAGDGDVAGQPGEARGELVRSDEAVIVTAMETNGHRPDLASAIRHLRKRAAQIEAVDSRHRPHWTQADLDAVSVLVDIPASVEQIALARIEGVSANGSYVPDNLKLIHRISRRALGLPVT